MRPDGQRDMRNLEVHRWCRPLLGQVADGQTADGQAAQV
jgi:hypothetical protein